MLFHFQIQNFTFNSNEVHRTEAELYHNEHSI